MRYLKLNLVTLLSSLLFCSGVFAVSFGEPLLRSYLGQPLNVQVPISGITTEDLNSSCVQGIINTIEGDYIASTHPNFTIPQHNDLPHGSALVNFITNIAIDEPAIALSISIKCGPLIQRNFALLLDYPEMTNPALISVADSSSNKYTVTPPIPEKPATNFTEPVAARKITPTRSQRSNPANPTNSAKKSVQATTQKSTEAVKPGKSIRQKLAEQAPPPKDALKISNQAITQTATATSPPDAGQGAVNIEQQRIQENSLASERVAAMLRDEPALLAEQESLKEKNLKQQIKVHQLELELQRLKLQVQSVGKPPEQPVPMALIVLNVVVLLVLSVLLLVVGKLWLSLRKVSQPHKQHWWSTAPDNQQKNEVLPTPANEIRTHKVGPGPTLQSQKPETVKKAEPESRASEARQAAKETSFDAQNDSNGAEHLSSQEGSSHPFNLFTNRLGQSIQIEELSDSTQEAEFWVSLDNPKRAIEILESQSLDDNLTMPVTLLYLLDLYRMVGDEEKYTQLSVRLKRKFNINIPPINEDIDPGKLKYLEDYEHVISRCSAFWNTNYIMPYLESLLIDDREGDRIGFDLSVYRDILFLISICKELDRTKNIPVTTL